MAASGGLATPYKRLWAWTPTAQGYFPQAGHPTPRGSLENVVGHPLGPRRADAFPGGAIAPIDPPPLSPPPSTRSSCGTMATIRLAGVDRGETVAPPTRCDRAPPGHVLGLVARVADLGFLESVLREHLEVSPGELRGLTAVMSMSRAQRCSSLDINESNGDENWNIRAVPFARRRYRREVYFKRLPAQQFSSPTP